MLGGMIVPQLSWAFPRGWHHQLILAAIGMDEQESLDAAHSWLAENDIDEAPFRDQRLLLAVTARFGPELKNHSAYPRLIGLQRLLWTRSLMALQEAKKSLADIAGSGIDLLLIKGASRLAIQNAASKQRAACDIDVVVRPECMVPAFGILVANNWTPSPGTSCKYIRAHLSSIRSINLFKGNWGDIDLHSHPFHPGQGGRIEDAQLWAAAQPAVLGGVSVRVPRCEDRVALAIAHGGFDGHLHSDWLVDCATILQNESLDWQRLDDIIRSREIAVAAAVTFQYFKEELHFAIPEEFVRGLTDFVGSHPAKAWSGILQVRPKERSGPFGQVLRALAKRQRKVSGARQMTVRAKDRILNVRRVTSTKVGESGSLVKSYRLTSPPECQNKETLNVDIVLDVQPTSSRRRIEMEINSADAHLCRIRFRKWSTKNSPLRLHLSGTIPNRTANSEIELVARPGRQLRSFASESEKQRYDSLAFRVVSCLVS